MLILSIIMTVVFGSRDNRIPVYNHGSIRPFVNITLVTLMLIDPNSLIRASFAVIKRSAL